MNHTKSFPAQWHAKVYRPTYVLDFTSAKALFVIISIASRNQREQEAKEAKTWCTLYGSSNAAHIKLVLFYTK